MNPHLDPLWMDALEVGLSMGAGVVIVVVMLAICAIIDALADC